MTHLTINDYMTGMVIPDGWVVSGAVFGPIIRLFSVADDGSACCDSVFDNAVLAMMAYNERIPAWQWWRRLGPYQITACIMWSRSRRGWVHLFSKRKRAGWHGHGDIDVTQCVQVPPIHPVLMDPELSRAPAIASEDGVKRFALHAGVTLSTVKRFRKVFEEELKDRRLA